MPRRRYALVYNATAGVAWPRLLDGVLARLRDARAEVFVLPARNAEEATARVAETASSAAADVVLSAGGDGTFRAVATGAAGSALPVGVIPLGTGNVIARELGIRRTADGVAATLIDGAPVAARGGLVNDAPFFLMCGAGFDGRIIAGLDYATKRAIGRVAYVKPTLAALKDGPAMFDVVVDGAKFEASWVIVAKSRLYGGSFELSQSAGLGGERMIAVVIAARSRLQLIEASMALARGRLGDAVRCPSFVSVLPASSVEIGMRIDALTEIDGDAAGLSPLSIRRDGPTALVLAPPGYAAKVIAHAEVADLTKCHSNRLS